MWSSQPGPRVSEKLGEKRHSVFRKKSGNFMLWVCFCFLQRPVDVSVRSFVGGHVFSRWAGFGSRETQRPHLLFSLLHVAGLPRVVPARVPAGWGCVSCGKGVGPSSGLGLLCRVNHSNMFFDF